MEQWNAYTADGTVTDKILIRGEPIPAGLYHLVCEVLVRHIDGSYLCMRRDLGKPSYPGLYEASAGGAAQLGEDPLTCIRRELFEETGIRCDDFSEIGRYTVGGNAIFHCFICTVDVDKSAIRLQKGETTDYMWLTEEAFIRFLHSEKAIESQIRRYRPYYERMGYID